jgi:hypothetical protein
VGAAQRRVLAEQQAIDGVERLFFVRSAYLGSQPLVSVVWAGDQQTDFQEGTASVGDPDRHRPRVTGFPFFGHDIAGYMHLLTTPTTRELWYRWVTLGALSPVMRTHHGRAPLASWSWESDAASTAHLARWARLHMQLFPYLMSMAPLAVDEGMPMFRPLALAYPDFEAGWTSKDQFMLGDRIVVAPVVTMGATERRVELPPGRWFPLLGGPAREGGVAMVAAPLEEIPAFVPAGHVLVLLPDDVDTVVSSSSARTIADAGDDREIRLWPGGSGRLTEVSGLAYQWDAGGLDGAPASATWNGAPVDVDDLEVVGPGCWRWTGPRCASRAGGPIACSGCASLRPEPGPYDRRSGGASRDHRSEPGDPLGRRRRAAGLLRLFSSGAPAATVVPVPAEGVELGRADVAEDPRATRGWWPALQEFAREPPAPSQRAVADLLVTRPRRGAPGSCPTRHRRPSPARGSPSRGPGCDGSLPRAPVSVWTSLPSTNQRMAVGLHSNA